MSLDAEPGPCATLVYWTRDGHGNWASAHSTPGPVEARRVNECCRPERLTRAGDDCNYWCAGPRAERRRGDDGNSCSSAERLRGCLLGNATEPYESRCGSSQPPPPPMPTAGPGDSDGGIARPPSSGARGTRTPRRGMGTLLMQLLVISSVLAWLA